MTGVHPLFEPFDGSPLSNDWTLSKGVQVDADGLRLTTDEPEQAGLALLSAESFPAGSDLVIDFDYAVTGGQGVGGLGDGFSVLLLKSGTDAPGAHGAGLGYSFVNYGKLYESGVADGYVGIGFDTFGDFATGLTGTGGTDRRPDDVGVRGAGSRFEGFPWLGGAAVEGGFRGGWADGRHAQVWVAGGHLRVTLWSADRPEPNVVVKDLDVRAQLKEPFMIAFAAATGDATAEHRIRNVEVTLPASVSLGVDAPAEVKPGEPLTYTMTVWITGLNDCPDAVVHATLSPHLTVLEGPGCSDFNYASHGQGSIVSGVLTQPVSFPAPTDAADKPMETVTLRCMPAPGYEGDVQFDAWVTTESRVNTSDQSRDSKRTVVRS
ncbi:hypothetical protein [Streptomyces sp. CBMA156]|uniref:hypothetical protein n=1 Tax=Streptomyces sp. CBMA156 TaxID=1930280 RepID=UPI001661A8E0|nr:hypothetical protein [Streptomyces sp. CBMA156]MBD0674988.1 hypothetical protein [Streptomyces sp. CBMA156]